MTGGDTFTIPFLTPNNASSSNPTVPLGATSFAAHASPISRPVAQLVIRPDEADLVSDLTRLYFSTVHCKQSSRQSEMYWIVPEPQAEFQDFGYLSFIHEADYWDRVDRGNCPVGLTLLMAANALR